MAARASVGKQAPEQVAGFGGALRRGQLEPVARTLGRKVGRIRAQTTVFELGLGVTGAGRLTQQFVAHAPVARTAALVAQHLAQATLRHDHALACGLLEQASGKVLDMRLAAQVRAVEQPEGDLEREAFARCGFDDPLARRDDFFALKHRSER